MTRKSTTPSRQRSTPNGYCTSGQADTFRSITYRDLPAFAARFTSLELANYLQKVGVPRRLDAASPGVNTAQFQSAKRNTMFGPLVARRTPSAPARQTLGRPKFNGHVLLRLHRPPIQERGLVMPLSNRTHRRGKKRARAAHALYIQHLAELSNGGADLHGFSRSMSLSGPRITRPNEGDELAGLQSSGFLPRSKSSGRNQHRKLRGHRKHGRRCDRLFRQGQPERFAAVAWAIDKDCGRR